MEDVGDCLSNTSWVTNLIIDYPCLFEEQLMVDVNISGSNVLGISPEVVKLIHVDPIKLIANNLILPYTVV